MQQDVSRPDRSRCEEGHEALKSPFGPEPRTDTAEQTTRCRFIITDDPEIRSRELNSAITALAREGLAVTRIGNPLTAPLTARRIIIQLDFDSSDDSESEEGDEAYLARILKRLAARGPLTLVIEQAETLDTAALRTLWQTGVHNESVVILFVGTTGFWPLLRQADLAPPHNELKAQGTLSEEITKPASHEQRTYPSASSLHARPYAEGLEAGTLRQPKVTPTRPSWTWRLYTAFLITLVLGVGVAANRLFYHATPRVSVTQRETSSDNVTTA